MASSGNFPKWSPLFKDTETAALKNGNTTFDGTTNGTSALTDFAIPTGTKFYAEIIAKLGSNYYNIFGIAPPTMDVHDYARNLANVYAIEQRTDPGAYKTNSISNTTVGSLSSSQGDLDTQVITYGIAVNRVDNEIKLYLNNTLKYTLSIPSTGEFHFMCSFTGGNNATSVRYHFNGGHDSTGAGDTTAGSNTDENGFGEFQYSPPSGFLAPCSANLPTSSDIDPGETDDNFPQKLFNSITWTGNRSSNSTTNSITGVGFQPDLVWLKFLDQTYDWRLVDSSRGVTKAIRSNQTTVQQTESNGLFQFDSDGFTVRGDNNYNYNGGNFIGYCWRANGGTTASNSNGSITSTVQTNPAGNFSIITYTGTGSNATIGHGMTKKPAFIVVKNLDDSDHWAIYHESMTADFYTAFTGSIFSNNATFWNDTEPTTSVISIGTNNRVNGSSDSLVCYAWAQEEGYMKFNTFTGNGNDEGPFVYTGFRPRMIFIKKNANSADWHNFDTARNIDNPVDSYISWDATTTNDTAASNSIDFLSNGFKVRNSAAGLNTNGSTYVYGAWGDVPAKYNNSF